MRTRTRGRQSVCGQLLGKTQKITQAAVFSTETSRDTVTGSGFAFVKTNKVKSTFKPLRGITGGDSAGVP